MESVMKNGFAELSADEMNEVDGGTRDAARFVLLLGGALSMGIGAPIGGIIGGPARFAAFYTGGLVFLGKGIKG